MTERRRREEEIAQMSGTPYISRTPFGGEGYGLETPMYGGRRDNKEEDESSKKRKVDTSHGLDVSTITPVEEQMNVFAVFSSGTKTHFCIPSHRTFNTSTPRKITPLSSTSSTTRIVCVEKDSLGHTNMKRKNGQND